jgi:hypothetical protein
MNKNTYRSLTIAIWMSLLSSPLFAEGVATLDHPANNNPSSASVVPSREAKNKKVDSAYRQWVEEKEERSGHVGYGFFQKDNKK